MILALALAAAAAEPTWADLTPWRTWLLLEDVGSPRHWFVVDDVPKLDRRCEIGVAADDPKAEPILFCGPAQIGDGRRAAVPADQAKAARRATQALAALTGVDGPLEVAYLGTLRRVSFRQVVVTRPDADPTAATALSVRATWSVHADGAIDEGGTLPAVERGPLCLPGLHARCDRGPGLLPYQPAAGWDGMLYDPAWVQHTDGGEVAALIRAATAASAAKTWAPAPPREIGPTTLPADLRAGLAVDLAVSLPGEPVPRQLTIDLPLNEAAFRAVRVKVPVEGTSLQVEVEARLPSGALDVRVYAPHGEAGSARFTAQCALVTEGARAIAEGPCPTDASGRWLYARDAAGTELARLQLADALEPLVVPSTGPGLR